MRIWRKVNFAESAGYKVVQKKTSVGKINCGWTTQVIDPSLSHLTAFCRVWEPRKILE